jgi:protein-disulfide isomerase
VERIGSTLLQLVAHEASPPERPDRVPAGANADADGIVVGNGPVTVDAYIDFQCMFCRQFMQNCWSELRRMLKQGRINLVYHPLNLLDVISSTDYSWRAAAAAGCAADGEKLPGYAVALYANQPAEGGPGPKRTPGLSDEELVEIGHSVGLEDQGFGSCVPGQTYMPWAAYVTSKATARGIDAIPTIFVNGTQVHPNAAMIEAAVEAAGG